MHSYHGKVAAARIHFPSMEDSPDTAILWCPGTMGVGKTVLMANVVTYLHSSRTSDDIISYYFCHADNAASLSARNILGSFARQILENYIAHAKYDDLIDTRKETRDLDADEVTDFLLPRLEVDKKYYLVLDGLDQCENSEIQKVARGINELCKKHIKSIKIICGGRPELEQQLFKAVRPDYKISVKPDMDTYITTTLSRRLEEGQLRLGDPKLILKISEGLQRGSNGM
jgi:NACHT domain.